MKLSKADTEKILELKMQIRKQGQSLDRLLADVQILAKNVKRLVSEQPKQNKPMLYLVRD
jgi:hypothetical protein